MRKTTFVLLIGLLLSLGIAAEQVNVQLRVQGNIFTMELFDGNNFPIPQKLDLGTFRPGETDFPVEGSIVAACKSNTGFQWQLIAEGTPMIDQAQAVEMPQGSLLARGLDPITSGGEKLPGNLLTTIQKLDMKPVTIYTSNEKGDLGFNSYEGTYVPVGLGINIPGAQPSGEYTGTILFTLTE